MEYLTQNWLLILALVFVVFMLGRSVMTRFVAGYKEVEPAEATRMMNHENALVLDVREPKEWQEGHLPGAMHIPLGQLSSRTAELEKFKERPIITQCRSGARSAMAAASLKRAGFVHVFNLKGGIVAWRNAGLPVERK